MPLISQRARPTLLGSVVVFSRMVSADYTMVPRWGHATTYIPSPPTLVIHGGKTDPSGSFTYNSAPNSNDLIILDLTSSWNTSQPPYILITTTQSPATSFHTLSLFLQVTGYWDITLFGGIDITGEGVDPTLLALDVQQRKSNWTEPMTSLTGWSTPASQRIHHSTTGIPGSGVSYISGGQKPDGSGTIFSDVYKVEIGGWTALPSLPVGIFNHISVMLSNGTLLILGGASLSTNTGNAAVRGFDTLYVLDTNTNSGWDIRVIAGTSIPEGRIAAAGVLIEDGKIVILGGADATLTEVYGDGWTLDLSTLSWSQIAASGGPSARYGQSAIAAGDQVVVFGGYGDSGPADAGTYVYNSSSNSWSSSYNPSSSDGSSSTTSSPTSGTSSNSVGSGSGSSVTGTNTAGGGSSNPSQTKGGGGLGSITGSSTNTGSRPSMSGSAGANEGGDGSSTGLSVPAQIGLALGVVALVAGLILAIILLCRRKRRKQSQAAVKAWDQERRGMVESRGLAAARPYGSRKKGGQGLLDVETENEKAQVSPPLPPPKNGAMAGLGLGMVGAGLTGLSKMTVRSFSGPAADNYTPLAATGGVASPERKPTRKEGQGIRLIGPRSIRSPPPGGAYSSSGSSGYSGHSGVNSPPRVNMLEEEDSRVFGYASAGGLLAAGGRSSDDYRRPVSGISSNRSDPFTDIEEEDEEEEDDQGSELEVPVFPGGPVPTPRDRRSHMEERSEESSGDLADAHSSGETFGARDRPPHPYRLPSFDYSPPLDADGFLAVPTNRDASYRSLPRSERSMGSGFASDMEEGTIHHATRVTSPPPQQIASLVPSRSPSDMNLTPIPTGEQPQEYKPIKRSESFFRRMAAGGISGLFGSGDGNHTGGNLSRSNTTRTLDIRDPAPEPTLWPIHSRDESTDAGPSRNPPSSWNNDDLAMPPKIHHKGVSISSLQSARSMRDMVIIQREDSGSSLETSAMIEQATGSSLMPSTSSAHGHHGHWTEGEDVPQRTQRQETILEERSSNSGSGSRSGNTSASHTTESFSELLRPSVFPLPPTTTTSIPSTPPRQDYSFRPSPLSPSGDATPTSANSQTRSIPQGSPLPPELVSHRRPVRDMVSSINRRAGPAPLFSPVSQYSPQGTPRPGVGQDERAQGGRPKTMYEAVKRTPLTVANPDESSRLERTRSR